MRAIVGLVAVILYAACSAPQVPPGPGHTVAMALGTSRTFSTADGVRAITVPAPAWVFVVQNFQTLSQTEAGPDVSFPRDVPVSMLGDGSGKPIFVVVLPIADGPVQTMDGGKCTTNPGTPNCRLCMACMGCCLPPPSNSGQVPIVPGTPIPGTPIPGKPPHG